MGCISDRGYAPFLICDYCFIFNNLTVFLPKFYQTIFWEMPCLKGFLKMVKYLLTKHKLLFIK